MTKEVKAKKKVAKSDTYETLRALYYSGKVKPSLNRILAQLESGTEDIELTLLACQCLVRTKNFSELSKLADSAIKLDPNNGEGFYYKGVALHNSKGKEQDALKNFNESLALSPENIIYLKGKGATHYSLFTDYNLPIKFAEKHRVKAEASLLKIIELVEQKEDADYVDFFTIAEVRILMSQTIDAKKYFIKALKAFDAAEKSKQDMNIYKDIIKAQKACIKMMEKVTES